ncbi:MAG: OB-fold nucleic acid binding domain-containing protein [Candidatus Aenigmatarchaeota archaeon]
MELKRVSIGNLIPGMQNVDVIGVVTRISRRGYSTEKGSGQLLALNLSDETGSIRLTLWNEEVERAKDIVQGDVVKISGYVRAGLYGPELRLGRFGKLERAASSRRAMIAELQEGQKKELRAMLVQLFESNPFYEICPTCGVTLKEDQEGNYTCITHGKVDPAYALHVSGVLDDGSGAMRCVAFKEVAEALLGLKVAQAKDIVLRKGLPALFGQAKMRELVLAGTVRRNKLFDRLEFIIESLAEPDVRRETEMLLSEGAKEGCQANA